VHVDATDFTERLTGCRDLADRMHELASALTGRVAEELGITDGSAVARGECRLVVRELVERSTMTLAHADESLVGPAGDLSDVLGGRRRQGVQAQHARNIADVHAIERERVLVHV
jgi:hypothetical protein